jgi:DNA-binding NtrC family response regulator
MPQAMKHSGAEMEKIKILLVDDEEELVNTLSERIEMRGFEAVVAFNGEEALRVLETNVPDVVILDLRMPGLDGMQVLERMKKTHSDIEVIILTGHGSHKDETEAVNLGAFSYLQKPVQIDVLIENIIKANLKRRNRIRR